MISKRWPRELFSVDEHLGMFMTKFIDLRVAELQCLTFDFVEGSFM